MYRLKFRKSPAGIFALILGAVLIVVAPFVSVTSGFMYDLPFAYLAGAQALLLLLFALINYRACPFIQQVRAFLVTCSIIGFFGLLANKGCPWVYSFIVIQQDWLLHFSAVTLGIMNLSALIAAVNLMQAEQMSSFADTQVAEAQLGRLKAVKVDPETQAKWEKAAAYADRSADGRSLRSTMTNLKAISLTEPGQELKPTMRETPEKDRSPSEKQQAGVVPSGDDGSLANLLDRIDDMPLVSEGEDLSAIRNKPALSGNSFINDVPESEPADTGASFLDSILNAKIQESDDLTAARTDGGDMGLPAEDAETIDVAALLDSFPDDSSEGEAAPPEPDSLAEGYTPAPLPFMGEDKFDPKPKSTQQIEKLDTRDGAETTRTSSFANASLSRNSLPALQPLHEGASAEVSALSSSDTSNFPVPNAAPQALSSGAPMSSPTNTNNKLAAMKRRNTSTFTKLNALSASGTGSLQPPKETEEPDGLKSLLDRLDDDQTEEPVKKVEEAAKPIEPPVELTIDTVFREDGTPEVAPTPRATAAASKPVAAQPVEVKADEAKKEPKPEPMPEPVPQLVVEEQPSTKFEAAPGPSFDLADRLTAEEEGLHAEAYLPSESLMAEAPAAEEPKAEEYDSILAANLDAGAPLANLLDRSLGDEAEAEEQREQSPTVESLLADEDNLIEARENVFGSGVDSDIDNIFSELAPPEAQLAVGEKPAPKVSAPVELPQHEERMPTFSASESLFAGGVDSDLDNIFSEMAPAAAQDKLDSEPVATTHGAATAEMSMPQPLAEPAAEAVVAAQKDEDEEEPAEAPASLFDGGLDSEIDDIFSELAPPEAQKEVTHAAAAAARQAEKAEEFAPAAQAEPEPEADAEAEPAEGGLFGDDLGQELDNIFSGLTESAQLEVTASTLAKVKSSDSDASDDLVAAPPPPPPPPPPVEKVVEPVAEAAAQSATMPPKPEAPKYKEVKEFGRLSSKPGTIPKFAGDTGGTMKTIGKLLLDVQAVENIIKSGETKKIGAGLSTAKIISAARGEGIKNILNAIDTYEGVAGSLIVGHDGLVIASTVGTGWDKDMLGALSTALLSTSNLATKKLEIGKLRQMVMLTGLSNGDGQQFKTTVLTDVDVGILAVFLEKTDLQKIDGLLDTIQTTIHGG